MCVVVDTNCFSAVFDPSNAEHYRFAPVYKWLSTEPRARLVFGGTKYRSEVNFRNAKYRRLLVEFERKNRLIQLNDADVDKRALAVRKIENSSNFDDEHIVAIIGVSGCGLVCSDDKRMYPFIRMKNLYPPGVKPPSIYTSARNSALCCRKKIVGVCVC